MPITVGQKVSDGGRKRNTSNNMMSKQNFPGSQVPISGISGGGLPTLDPSAVANYYGQIQTLQSTLANQLAMLKSQRTGLKGEASVQTADTRQAGQQALTEGINASLERGMLGSSADVEQRIGTIAQTKSGVADIHRQLWDALAQSRLQGAGAALGYEQGVQQVEAQAIGQRMQLQAEERQNALAIQVAQMNARASQISSNAQMAMAQAQLQSSQSQLAGVRALAGANPFIAIADMYRTNGTPIPSWLKPLLGKTPPAKPYYGRAGGMA